MLVIWLPFIYRDFLMHFHGCWGLLIHTLTYWPKFTVQFNYVCYFTHLGLSLTSLMMLWLNLRYIFYLIWVLLSTWPLGIVISMIWYVSLDVRLQALQSIDNHLYLLVQSQNIMSLYNFLYMCESFVWWHSFCEVGWVWQ